MADIFEIEKVRYMTGNENVRIGGILLAAGGSSRMGTPKQFVRFEGETLLRRAASAIASVCDPVIAVLGAEKETAETEIEGIRVETRFNREWQTGMSSSIKIGLAELISIEPPGDGKPSGNPMKVDPSKIPPRSGIPLKAPDPTQPAGASPSKPSP